MTRRDSRDATELSGWGRYPVIPCLTHAPATATDLARAIGTGPVIARGAGRAYGDSSLQRDGVIRTDRLDKGLSLDPATGVLEAGAGASFADVLDFAVPQGWFPPVTPGTKFVTLGGALAADVHGKNHHVVGSFGDHVLWFDLVGPDGATTRCDPQATPELFQATIGGMGLTGIVSRMALQMLPVETAWIRLETIVAPDLDSTIEAFEQAHGRTYTVAWIDAMTGGRNQGRSVLLCGEHASLDELPRKHRAEPFALPKRRSFSVPRVMPGFLLNKWSGRALNTAYWMANKRKAGTTLVDYDSYFYPLDSVLEWNRVYGRRGFVQYQCVLPIERSPAGLRQLLDAVGASGQGAFLAVLKLMGKNDRQGLSFPMEGYTLALDFPVTPALPRVLAGLDAIVSEHGGRIYLAKDARMDSATFRQGYAGLAEFEALRQRTGAAGVFRSNQSERLGLS